MFATVLERLLGRYGRQGWWPADSELEIMVGAVLVQRTAWRNAAAAVERLKSAGALSTNVLTTIPLGRLEHLITSAGFFRVKAKRLRALADSVARAGGVTVLRSYPTPRLRAYLLDVHGIGPETADSILGYAFERPVFVVDAYARRLFARLAYPDPLAADATLKSECEHALKTASNLNELHALIIAHGRASCGSIPRCLDCCLKSACGYARAESLASA
jgi:endonuclease-3 related protein